MKKIMLKIGALIVMAGMIMSSGFGLKAVMATDVIGNIEGAATIKNVDPSNPEEAVSSTIEVVLDIAFGIAVLLVLANLIWASYQWIMSGGDSGKLQSARNRMIFAVIGLLILAAAWPITKLVQDMLIGEGQNNSKIQLE